MYAVWTVDTAMMLTKLTGEEDDEADDDGDMMVSWWLLWCTWWLTVGEDGGYCSEHDDGDIDIDCCEL